MDEKQISAIVDMVTATVMEQMKGTKQRSGEIKQLARRGVALVTKISNQLDELDDLGDELEAIMGVDLRITPQIRKANRALQDVMYLFKGVVA